MGGRPAGKTWRRCGACRSAHRRRGAARACRCRPPRDTRRELCTRGRLCTAICLRAHLTSHISPQRRSERTYGSGSGPSARIDGGPFLNPRQFVPSGWHLRIG
eukprot:EG_transcript_22878